MRQLDSKQGFTLIELLVVISIISLLASIVLASLNSARSKARDARRVADFGQLRTALEFYYDSNNAYPGANGVCNPGVNEHNDGWCRDMRSNTSVMPIENWIPGLSAFLPSMPHNPKPYSSRNPMSYHYYCGSGNQAVSCSGVGVDSQTYWLFTNLENDTPRTCGGGAVYIWYDGITNACGWLGTGVYVIKNF